MHGTEKPTILRYTLKKIINLYASPCKHPSELAINSFMGKIVIYTCTYFMASIVIDFVYKK
jgi:hypothetical protein